MTQELTLDTIDIIRPENYGADGYPHAAWKLLRREAPIYYWDRGVMNPFWAVTRHEDIVWLSKQPRRFQNGPRMAVLIGVQPADPPAEQQGEGKIAPGEERLIRQLLNMDPPEHGRYRKVSSSWPAFQRHASLSPRTSPSRSALISLPSRLTATRAR